MKLLHEAAQWKAKNEKIREWLLKHPHRMDQEQWHVAINTTEVFEAELYRDMKKQPSARQLSLRTRLKNLLFSIVALLQDDRKKGVQWHGRTV